MIVGFSRVFSVAASAIAVSHSSSPFVSAYPWSSVTGFGAKFANPGTLPAGNGFGVAFSPANDVIAVAHASTPYISAYPWASGFGTKFSDPATLPPTAGSDVSFSPAGDAIVVGPTVASTYSAYPWAAGFGTKFSDPGSSPGGGNSNKSTFRPSGSHIALTQGSNPFGAAIHVYPWSGSGFGTKIADPGTSPTGGGIDVAWTPAGDFVAVAHGVSPWVSVYPFVTGFGTRVSNPATLPVNSASGLGEGGVAFSPDGTKIAVASDTSPFIFVYPWSGAWGTKLANPGTLPTGAGKGIAWTAASDAVAISHSTTPFVSAYPVSTSFGTKFSDPATLPTGNGNGLDFTH